MSPAYNRGRFRTQRGLLNGAMLPSTSGMVGEKNWFFAEEATGYPMPLGQSVDLKRSVIVESESLLMEAG